MFKKLVSSVSLSPSAIGDLANYSKKIKQQTSYRIASAILFLLVLMLELVIVYSPSIAVLPNEREINDMVTVKNTDNLIYSIEAKNISQGNSNAAERPAQSADQLIYTLTIKNISSEEQAANFSIDLKDVFDYASLLNNGDASLNGTLLEWPKTIIDPGQDQTRTFTIKMSKDISTAPMNKMAYDCKMTTFFGDASNSVVRCSTVKVVETEMNALPKLSATISITIVSVALITSMILLFRNIQLRREIKIIRNQLTEGAL